MSKSYRIGIDARIFGAAGPGRYTKAIVEHLEKIDKTNEYIIFLRKDNFDLFNSVGTNFKKVLADYKWYSWNEQIGFLFKVLSYRLNLFYVPHFNIPVLYIGKLVTAVPDIIMHKFSTDAGTTLWKPYFKFKKFIYRLVVPWALLRAAKNIVPSNDVLNDLITEFPFISKNKYVVAYEGIDPVLLKSVLKPEEVLKKLNISQPFLLYVSSMYDHKNVCNLIKAFEILATEHGYKGQLVLVGKKDKFSERVARFVAEKNLRDKVLMPGETRLLSDDEVTALRQSAQAYVFPSLKEGFSLTPLEAQYWKLPCVISDISCHKEVYGDSVQYFNPNDINDMANQINLVLTDKNLRDELIQKGLENTKKYSWEKTAKLTLEVFLKVLK